MGFLSFLSQLLPVFGPVRGQNWSFCPFLSSRTAIFEAFEDKSAIFVLFESIFPRFWAISRTKSRFLSSGGLPDGTFPASRAQKWHFCALLSSRWHIEPPSERKTPPFARLGTSYLRSGAPCDPALWRNHPALGGKALRLAGLRWAEKLCAANPPALERNCPALGAHLLHMGVDLWH